MSPRRNAVKLAALIGAVGAFTAVMWLMAVPADGPARDHQGLAGLVLFVLFVVAESAQVHIEVRRETYSLSLSELPLVVGLFFTDPLMLLVARLAAYAIVAAVRRVLPMKAVFNFVSIAAEVSVAAAIFGHLAGGLPLDPAAWGAAYVAVLAAVIVGGTAVGLAVVLVQPPFTLRIVGTVLIPTLVAAVFSTTLSLLTVVLVDASGYAVIGLAIVAAVLVLAFRRFGGLVSEHKSLGELYELTRQVSTSMRGNDLDQAVLARVRQLMRAEVAQLWLAEEQTVDRSADSPIPQSRLPGEPLDVIRGRVMSGESVLAGPRTREPELRAALEERRTRELVAVPLRVGGEVVGSLEVLDRQGERSHFVPTDRTLLETLAVHTGVALENARLVRRLRHDADHDPLTGLPNRRAFVDRLDRFLRRDAHDELTAVLVLDLQSFKDVNDTLGRAAGDRLLADVAALVRTAAPNPDAVARLSSDELGVFLAVPDLATARDAAAHLQAALATPLVVAGVEIEVGAVVGIAVHPEHGADAITLVQRADVAMYAAKRASRGVLAYVPAMDAPSVRRLGLVAELRRALEAGDLDVWYQPQVRLAESELVGLEALVRWEHFEHGFIPPDEFVPLAEHTGLIGPLTAFVLRRALEDLHDWRARGHHFGMSVNISVRSLLDPGFAEEVGLALAAAQVPAALLTLEITESSVMADPDRAMPVLEALRRMGVRLSVDDFGIGQSSLTYLRRLPVSEVKIDRSFVSGMVHDAGDMAIVRAVIDLSAPLGLTVVAEGVESEETRRELTRLGCAIIQGYLLSRPLPRDGIEAWFERRTVAEPGLAGGRSRWLRVVND